MEELFTKRINEYIELTNLEINDKINSANCFLILNDSDEYIHDLIESYSIEPFVVDFDKIKCEKQPNHGIDMYGNHIESYKYTFKVPFDGDIDLLKYRPNKGSYKSNTFFIENNLIIFQSLNNDLNPTPPRFYNSIKTLRSIISNLLDCYKEWNINLNDKIESKVNYRKKFLIEFNNFCNQYELTGEEIEKMKFKLAAIETLSKIIADNHSGSEITTLFKKAGFPEIVHDGDTKWKFICTTFEDMQNESIEGFYKILKVLEVVCDPQEYILNPELHEDVLEKINKVLSFYGLKFNEEGTLLKRDSINTTLKTQVPKISEDENEHYDVFISHSSADKEWVNKLYECLSKTELRIWYDIAILQIGDNIREKINDGLTKSDYGIVVLSKDFINRQWPKMEFEALLPLIEEGKLLPINHGLTSEELEQFFKPLLNIQYVSSAEYSVKKICDDIYSKIKNK